MKRVTLAISLLVASAVAGAAQSLPFTPPPPGFEPIAKAQPFVLLGGRSRLYVEIEAPRWTLPQVAVLVVGARKSYRDPTPAGVLRVDPLWIGNPNWQVVPLQQRPTTGRPKYGPKIGPKLGSWTAIAMFGLPRVRDLPGGLSSRIQHLIRGQVFVGYWNGHFRPHTWRASTTFDFVVAY